MKPPKIELLLLVLLLAIGLVPRMWGINTNLQIHFDQGLHAVGIWRIWHDRGISFLGHQTDTLGIYHGPLYYWLMTPAYFFGRGDPVWGSVFQILLDAVGIFFLASVAKKLWDFKTALFSVILYAFSYGYASYARWLSNVTPTFPLSSIFLWCAYALFQGRVAFLPWSLLTASAITQMNGAIGVFLYPVVLFLFLVSPARTRLNFKIVSASVFAFIVPHSPLLLFELLNRYPVTRAVLNINSAGSAGVSFSARIIMYNVRTLLTELIHLTSYPFYLPTIFLFISGVILLLLRFRHPAYKFLSIFIFAFFISLSFYQRGAIGFFLVPLFLVFTLLFARVLVLLPRFLGLILLLLLLVVNFYHWRYFLIPHRNLTPIGTANLITAGDRKNIVDWIYRTANGRSFAFWIYTIPYFLDEPWIYYFWWYGQPKYGYQPVSTGGFNSADLPPSTLVFVIYEPDDNRPDLLTAWHSRVKEQFGPTEASFISNDARVELH
ncbi:MAG: hypothetical protein UX87_C0004G0020 [Candidatus Amesbacteria bacterium GW2011_GWA1_47_16]|uniref:Glycosyltransferase RgtA/B/C/D-like domain-containing protein n=1 Tax=Candidatus Amesbacteria bacterium GW2011_GWA1_47_16 TaxID=1618353 RepID=A0A0G1S5T2_9BACT|nr:MAG: hypothetical protein UX87_C0004G0020 [Candidatus Amesbacteria bacterium GW2011_GWA1_47_16]